MLFFCEECGGKNIVPNVTGEQKIVRFRCQYCQYETVVERKSESQKAGQASGVRKATDKTGSGTGPVSGS